MAIELSSQIIEIILVLVEVHFHLLLVLGHLLCSHLADQLVHVLVLDLLLFSAHYVLNVLVHHVHAFLLSHEALHRLLVVHALHLIVGAAHYLGHSRHHVLHGLIHAHLLQSEWSIAYSKVTFCSWASRVLYLLTIWLFFRICCAITFWDC